MTNKIDVNKIISSIDNVLKTSIISQNETYTKELNNIANRLKEQHFKYAVVGEFSSGKSTFINALLKADILKHGVKETTATIVEIESVSEPLDKQTFDVYYKDGYSTKNIPIEKLEEFTSTSSLETNVAEDIYKVVIKANILETTEKITFVDTPGLNGIADFHREKTLDQIKNSHACIYLIQVRGLGKSDIEFINFISKFQKNIIFIQNFIDELKELENETPESKLLEQKKIIDENLLLQKLNVKYTLVGISAKKALIAKSESIKSYHGETLTLNAKEQLYQESMFGEFLEVLNNDMKNNMLHEKQWKESVLVAIDLLKDFVNILDKVASNAEEGWKNSLDGKKQDLLNKTKNILVLQKNDKKINIENFINAEIIKIHKKNKNFVEEGIKKYFSEFSQAVSKVNEIEDYAAQFERINLEQTLYEHLLVIEKGQIKLLEAMLQTLFTNVILRIEEYMSDMSSSNNEIQKLNFSTNTKSNLSLFEQENKFIDQLEDELKKKRAEFEKDKYKKEQLEIEIREKNNQLASLSNELSNKQRQKNNRINALGQQPDKVEKTKTEITTVYRGGIGFLDSLLGPKIIEKTVRYYDDEAQQKWIQSKERIQHEYRQEYDKIQNQMRFLELKGQEYREDISTIDKMSHKYKDEIKHTESLLKAKMDNLKEKQEKAKKEYLAKVKNELLSKVQEYLFDVAYIDLYEKFEEIIENNKTIITKRALEIFEIAYDERLSSLNERIEGTAKETTRKSKKELEIINSEIIKMEKYVC